MASRCVAEGGQPVPRGSQRLRLGPSRIAVAASSYSPGLAASVTLGRSADDPTALYLKFDLDPKRRPIAAAFLLLDPQGGTARGGDLTLEVSRAANAWSAPAFAWDDQPGFAAPTAQGLASASAVSEIRVDVTEVARFLAQYPDKDFGVAVRAEQETEVGLTLATGVDGGRAPSLDVYFSP